MAEKLKLKQVSVLYVLLVCDNYHNADSRSPLECEKDLPETLFSVGESMVLAISWSC